MKMLTDLICERYTLLNIQILLFRYSNTAMTLQFSQIGDQCIIVIFSDVVLHLSNLLGFWEQDGLKYFGNSCIVCVSFLAPYFLRQISRPTLLHFMVMCDFHLVLSVLSEFSLSLKRL